MNEATALLFDEFATAYRRGESPDVVAFLERAGDDADALAALLDRFLQAVPARKPTEEEVVLARAALDQEPPLLVLRLRRALTRDAVVDSIMTMLGLDHAKRAKVASYYHQLEVGTLDPTPVDGRVWDALAEVFRANARRLVALRPPPLAAADAYLRLPDTRVKIDAAVAIQAVPEEPDEVDKLFTGDA